MKKTIPRRALILKEEEVGVHLKTEEDQQGRRRFSMIANSGKVIPGHWFWGNFIIDMKGVQVGRQHKPALRAHDSDRIVGWTEKISKDEAIGITAEGYFSKNTPDGQEVLALAEEGFPWQASIYIPPLAIEEIKEGQEVEVNGHKVKGPGTIFRKSRLREVSFCSLGADEDTSASALSDKSDDIELELEESRTPSPINNKQKEEVEGMEMKELKLEQLKLDRSDLADALLKEGADNAIKSERVRVSKILKEAAAFDFKGASELAVEFVEGGISVEDAISKLKDAKIAALQKQAPGSVGPGDGEPDLSNLSVEERAEKEFDKSQEIRDEFNGSKDSYIAFKKAEAAGNTKILKK